MADLLNNGDKDYSDTIEKLVEIRSKPLKKIENQKESLETKVQVLNKFQADFRNLKLVSDKLFGFDSGFKKKKFESEDETIISGNALEDAMNGTYELMVNQIARGHKISSEKIEIPKKLSKSNFKFRVGEKEYVYHFQGGDLSSLKNVISMNDGPIKLSSIKLDEKKSIVILSSEKAGKKNKLELLNDTGGIFDQLGLYIPSVDKSINVLENVELESLGEEKGSIDNNELVLKKNAIESLKKDIPRITNTSYLEISLKWDNKLPVKEKLYGDLTEEEKINFGEELDIEDESKVYSLPYNPDTDNYSISVIVNYEIDGNMDQKSYKINMLDFFSNKNKSVKFDLNGLFLDEINHVKIKKIDIKSNNLFRDISLYNMNVFIKADPNKKFAFIKELQKPTDASVTYEGIDIERETNEIKDIIPRLVLNLKKVSQTPVKLVVTSDMDKSKERLIDFLGQYNFIVKRMNIFMSRSTKASLDLTEEEEEYLGIFNGESNFRNLRFRLVNLVSAVYRTKDVNKNFTLSQLGITLVDRSLRTSSGVDNFNYGLVDFDEESYDDFVLNNSNVISDIFGYDSDGDGLIDNGFNYSMGELIRQYIGPGNTFNVLSSSWDSQSKNFDQKIERERKKIEQFKYKQQMEFSKLRQAQEEMKKMQQMIKAYSN